MKVEEIDFSPITYRTGLELTPFHKYRKEYLILIIAVVSVIAYSLITQNADGFTGLIWITVIASVYFGSKISKEKRKIWREFAKANGFIISSQKDSDLPPSIRHHGRKLSAEAVVEGKVNGVDHKLFEYTYKVGSGKSSSQFHITILVFELEKLFGHFILNSKYNRGGAKLIPKESELIQLEGNFNDYYDLYIERTNAVDVLSILTPDVMQTLMKSTKQYDVEVYNNKVFLFAEGDRRNAVNVKELYSGLEAISNELLHKQKSVSISQKIHLNYDSMRYINSVDAIRYESPNITLKIIAVIFIAAWVMIFIYFIYNYISLNSLVN